MTQDMSTGGEAIDHADQAVPSRGVRAVRLAVKDLCVRTSGRSASEVVDEVTFQVGAGEVLGLVGESGSGKTTVGLALLGYARRGLRIASGSVMVDSEEVLSAPARRLRALRGATLAYVPQDPGAALNPALRIETQLRETLSAHHSRTGDVRERMAEVLDEVRLPSAAGLLSRFPHQLSGGQQQRVALAMAFACRPSLIVLDEPTTGLDVTTQRHVLSTVRSLCSSHGVAAVYVSHDLAVVGGLVSAVAVMYAGRIVEVGPTERVFGRPVHPYTRGLLRAIPSPDKSEVMSGIPGQPPEVGRRPSGCVFGPRCELCTDKCQASAPSVTDVDGRQVRCWRSYESLGAERSDPVRLTQRTSGDQLLLEVDHLTAKYGSAEVLHDVSISLPAASCVAIVGESGSGKSTLARCIVGLHSQYAGRVAFHGSELQPEVKRRPADGVQKIRYVFQNPYTSLNPRRTIGGTIAASIRNFADLSGAELQDRVAAVLTDVLLSVDVMFRYPDQLSGGQRQRAAIARALAVEPEILICDEVTSALDVSVQADIVELLRGLQDKRGLAMIFITHNIALVRSIAQSIVVLSRGSVVESGPVLDVLDLPQNPYTIQLMQDVPRLSGIMQSPE